MDSMAHAASAVVRHSTMVIGAAADELARQDRGFRLGQGMATAHVTMTQLTQLTQLT